MQSQKYKLATALVLALLAVIACIALPMPTVRAQSGAEFTGFGADSSPEAEAAAAALQAQWEREVAAQGGLQAVQAAAQAAPPTRSMSGARTAMALSGNGRPYACLPTCTGNDARMLVLAGAGLSTLATAEFRLGFGAPADAASLEIGIFDGDTSGLWDSGSTPLEYTLYADPNADGTGTFEVGRWLGNTMPDNAWHNIPITNVPEAKAPSGNYFYVMTVRNTDPSVSAASGFKLRADGTTLALKPQAFGFIAALRNVADAQIVYPAWPALTPTTYDGHWNFYLLLPKDQTTLTAWDGDLDFAGDDPTRSVQDTDDPNTPPAPFLPSWSVGTGAVPEGVAVGSYGLTGGPPDDFITPVYRRTPGMRYELVAPDGVTYPNNNPSGNQEWENFTISTAPFDPSMMDHHAEKIPLGLWQVRITGMDLGNLNAWQFEHLVIGVDDEEDPVLPLSPHPLSGAVWYDRDADGVKDADEPGIGGVEVRLLDASGTVIATTTSDPTTGAYSFTNQPPALYTVQIGTTTLPAGMTTQTYDRDGLSTPDAAQVLWAGPARVDDVDFGYTGAGVLAGTVWNDADGDGSRDTGDLGIAGVTVTLQVDLNGDGTVDFTTTTTTDASGAYHFDHLPAGSYTVTVDSSSLPTDVTTPSYDLDGVSTPHTAVVALGAGATNDQVDFGYTSAGVIASVVWNDLDHDGIRDTGEPGVAGVTVTLQADRNGDGVVDFTATTTTDANGGYRFENLPAGNYTVTVDSSTLPADLNTPTYDLDGISTPHVAVVTLAAGATRNDVNFGYSAGTGSIASVVWNDLDHDGIRDAGEPGLSGVTVTVKADLDGDGVVDFTATTTTDANGGYRFENLPAGNYTVTVDSSTLPADLNTPTYDLDGISTPHVAVVTLAAGATRSDVNFGYAKDCVLCAQGVTNMTLKLTYRVSTGDASERIRVRANSLSGAVLYDQSSVAVGTVFSFAVPPSATQVVVTVQGNQHPSEYVKATFSAECNLAIGTENGNSYIKFKVMDAQFDGSLSCENPETGKIGNLVWFDANGNGVRDSGETGISGVTVKLLNSSGTVVATQVTGSDGSYQFTGIAAGTYRVQVDAATLPDGKTKATYDLDGISTPHVAVVTLAAGATRSDVNFGYAKDCVLCAQGVTNMTLKLTYRVSTGDASERIRVRANSLSGAVLYDQSSVAVGTVFSFAVPPSATQVVVTVQGNQHPSEYVKATFSAECNLAIGTENGNSYIKFKVMDAQFDGSLSCDTGGQGCTPGYWKQSQHFDSWVYYQTSSRYNTVFGVPYYKTLLEALRADGDGKRALGRHATAALLNAKAPGISYKYTITQIINMVKGAYANGNYESVKNQLALENERGCPLN